MAEKCHPSDHEDSMSDVESNEEIAQLGMLTIASSSDEAHLASINDPSSLPQKHSLVSGPITRSQAKMSKDKRSKSASPRRPISEFKLPTRRTPSKLPRASKPFQGQPPQNPKTPKPQCFQR